LNFAQGHHWCAHKNEQHSESPARQDAAHLQFTPNPFSVVRIHFTLPDSSLIRRLAQAKMFHSAFKQMSEHEITFSKKLSITKISGGSMWDPSVEEQK
jgi:hypothetical protein